MLRPAPSAPLSRSLPVTSGHRLYEDVQALVTGSLIAAVGVALFKAAGLLPGGTVGLALLAHYMSGLDLPITLLLANAPFYALAVLRMGREFTVKTLLAVGLVALFTWLLPMGFTIQRIEPWLAAVLGGTLAGMGILVLFRHRASLGGFNMVALYAQEKFGWPAGKVQMALDAAIVLGGGAMVGDLYRLACSVLAVVALNLVLTINHRPERYRALS